MSESKAFLYRVAAGLVLGLVVGLLGFFLMPKYLHDVSLVLRSAILLWYTTLGALIGMFGVFAYHPVLRFPMPWWLRGILFGGWMNFVLTLFAYDQISFMVAAIMGEYCVYASPFYMVIEGAIIGMLIDYLITRAFGEGWADLIGR